MMLYWIHCMELEAEYRQNMANTIHLRAYTRNSEPEMEIHDIVKSDGHDPLISG